LIVVAVAGDIGERRGGKAECVAEARAEPAGDGSERDAGQEDGAEQQAGAEAPRAWGERPGVHVCSFAAGRAGADRRNV